MGVPGAAGAALLITLVAGCHAAAPGAPLTVNEQGIDRGCLAITYADSIAGATLPPTLRLTRRRGEASDAGQRWYTAVVREGEVSSVSTPPEHVMRWHPAGMDSAVVEKTGPGGAGAVFRLQLQAPASGTVEGRARPGAPWKVVSFTAEKSLACYPFQL